MGVVHLFDLTSVFKRIHTFSNSFECCGEGKSIATFSTSCGFWIIPLLFLTDLGLSSMCFFSSCNP